MRDKASQFEVDKQENVTMSLAEFLDKNSWQVLACHPPGGHTSFSILDGRRSRGGYMPDVVAIKFNAKADDFIVIVAESQVAFQQVDKDIQKLLKLSDVHAQWIAFRLQKHIDSSKWLNNWDKKLQKLVAFAEGEISKSKMPEDVIAIKFNPSISPEIIIGKRSPARAVLINKTLPNK